MTYRIDCKKPEISTSFQFLKLSGLPPSQPASQPASQPNRVYKRILYLKKCAKNVMGLKFCMGFPESTADENLIK
jgi:hypothetical protein